MPPRSLLLLNSVDLHRVAVLRGGRYERYVLWLSPDCLSCFAQGQEYMLGCFFLRPFRHSQLLPPNDGQAGLIAGLFRQLIDQDAKDDFGQVLMDRLRVAELLLRINRIYLQYHAIHAEAQLQQYTVIFSCIQHIHSHLDQALTLDALSARLYISRRRLIDLFRDVTGTAPGHYILNCRMQKARACLVDETCARAGFGNLSHFIRISRQYQGVTPKQYMMRCREHGVP